MQEPPHKAQLLLGAGGPGDPSRHLTPRPGLQFSCILDPTTMCSFRVIFDYLPFFPSHF